MITLSELQAEKARLARQEANAIAVLHQVRGAMMQTDALIARAEKAQQSGNGQIVPETGNEPANGNEPPPEAA